MHRTKFRVSIILLLVAVLAVALVCGWGVSRFNAPRAINSGESDIIVYLPHGMPLVAVAQTLHRAGAIDNSKFFEWGVRILGKPRRLKAGEYSISPSMGMRGVMEHLSAGKTLLRAITIPEGQTVAEVIGLIGTAEGLVGEINDLPTEGSLLPETYKYTRGDRRQDLVQRMQTAMTDTANQLWATRKAELPLKSPAEAMVLASIIEKETAVPEERSIIAGVFVNRLRRGMRLQSDPTVVYALTHGAEALGRSLTFDDLKTDSPFNTYQVKGLPPGPITNSGRASLEAAVQPADTNAYYFVADGAGGHVFANTLAEHQKNVMRWRSLKRQRRKGR